MDIQLRGIAIAIATLGIGFSACALAQDPITGHSKYVDTNGNVVHCVSTESGRTYCGQPHMKYVISGAPVASCVEGKTWGVDDRGVWVSSGCVADFRASDSTVTSQSSYVNSAGNVVHCVSTASGRTYCGSPHMHYVIKNRPAACVEGTTWGFDENRGVWVSGGCTADFTVEESD